MAERASLDFLLCQGDNAEQGFPGQGSLCLTLPVPIPLGLDISLNLAKVPALEKAELENWSKWVGGGVE